MKKKKTTKDRLTASEKQVLALLSAFTKSPIKHLKGTKRKEAVAYIKKLRKN